MLVVPREGLQEVWRAARVRWRATVAMSVVPHEGFNAGPRCLLRRASAAPRARKTVVGTPDCLRAYILVLTWPRLQRVCLRRGGCAGSPGGVGSAPRGARVLSLLLAGTASLCAARRLALPWAPAAAFWALAGAGACGAVFLAWFLAALFSDLVLCPRGHRAGVCRPTRG